MKIRSYKGPSLDKLYEAIRKELGPDAIVISTNKVGDKRSLLGPLFGGEQHELIAVADDTVADQHLLNSMGRNEISEISEQQTRKWREMEDTIGHLRDEIRGLSKGLILGSDRTAPNVPEFAQDWDPRFLVALKSTGADLSRDVPPDRMDQALRSLLHVEPAFALEGTRKPHVIVCVGPTGSGKTTTLAKLAAQACLTQKLKVGMITTDTFRVAAVDQIREYATLLGIELAVAFSASEAAAAVKRFSDRDVIFVDTPGRNHYDQVGLAGIRGVLQGMGPVTVMLHIPAVLDRSHVTELITNFQVLKPNYIIWTKTDEIRKFAMLTTIACETDCPVAFITDGQRVPQDIHPASMNELINLLTPSAGGEPASKMPSGARAGAAMAQAGR